MVCPGAEGNKENRKIEFKIDYCFLMSLTQIFFSILSFQDENAAAQSILAVHSGPVRHLLPPLLQGSPLCLLAT